MKTIVIPDLHGDFDELCNILYHEGILKQNNNKYIVDIIKKNAYSKLNFENKKLVQLGDILDSKIRNYNSIDNIKYSDMLCFIFLCNVKKTFPNNVVLILGNHEYLNYNRVFNYVSTYSTRTNNEIKCIQSYIDKYFDYFYVDEHGYLYIHSSIPADTVSLKSLKDYESLLKQKYSKNDMIKLYERVFKRIVPSLNLLDLIGVKRVFMGHTPHLNVQIIDDRIYYVDNYISRSFELNSHKYQIINIESSGNVLIIPIIRKIKFN